MQSSWLNEAQSRQFFNTGTHHIAIPVKPLAAPSLLWLNRQVAVSDPSWAECHGDQVRYEQALLKKCGYITISPQQHSGPDDAATVIAHADRYGGSGIGNNGGSGRAALINGYLVKGIGPTPLIADNADLGHASGGAFLEEAIRECIYSEIVRQEFPHSAIPILAIIDTGFSQRLGADGRAQRRVLVVRPAFLRPAHFDRAVGYLAARPDDGASDFARVVAAFERAAPADALRHTFIDFFSRWSRQLAYAFAHRMPHGSNTMSNICLDGALLDFGATSAVPSWARVDTMLSSQSLVALNRMLSDTIWSMSYTLGRHLDSRYQDGAFVQKRVAETRAIFKRTLAIEMLRICGIEESMARQLMDGAAAPVLWHILFQLLTYFQREHLDHIRDCPPTHLVWDVSKLWSSRVPPHLHSLRAWLDKQLPAARWLAAAGRSNWLAQNRPMLYRENLKQAIFARIQAWGEAPARRDAERFIAQAIVSNRRDTRLRQIAGCPAGYAFGERHSYVLVRALNGDGLLAYQEGAGAPNMAPRRIRRWDANTMWHRDGAAEIATAAAVHVASAEVSDA